MKKNKNTWQAFQEHAAQVKPDQQQQLKGGYRLAPVQNSVPISNIVWTEIDIRSNNLSGQNGKNPNKGSFMNRP